LELALLAPARVDYNLRDDGVRHFDQAHEFIWKYAKTASDCLGSCSARLRSFDFGSK
jgi:hypothetical protein